MTLLGDVLPAEQPKVASAADRLVPVVHAKPLVQALGSLLGRGPGDAELVGDDRERHRLREVTQNLGLRSGDRRGPHPGLGLLRSLGSHLVGDAYQRNVLVDGLVGGLGCRVDDQPGGGQRGDRLVCSRLLNQVGRDQRVDRGRGRRFLDPF